MIGVDPGKKSPAHCMLDPQHPGRPLIIQRTPILGAVAQPVVIAEPHVRHKSNRKSLITLSLWAGFHGCYVALPGFDVRLVPERVWRNALLADSGQLPKPVFHARLRRYFPERLRTVAGLARAAKVPIDDAIDAWGIACGGQILYALESAYLKRVKL